jgi:vesicle transport through interaction with t-SNAREs protein 1
MSSIDEYEREFRGHVQAAEERLAHASRSSSPDDRRTALSGAERAAEAGKDVVQLMELEGRSLSGAARSKLQAQLRSYRDEISALKTRIKDLKSTARSPDHCREENCAGGDSYSNPSPGERSRLLANNDRMSKATDKLKQAHAVTLDMEQTANAILGDLGKQRETLMHAQGSLRYAADGLEGSRKLLAQMGRRAAMTKMTLWIVIGLVRASLDHSLLSNHAQRSPCLFRPARTRPLPRRARLAGQPGTRVS